jgi:hypothetical protein
MKIQLYDVNDGDAWPVDEKLGEKKSRSMERDDTLMVSAVDARKLLELLESSIVYLEYYSTDGQGGLGRTNAGELSAKIRQIRESNTIL